MALLDGIPNSVKTIVGAVVVIGTIIGTYKSVEGWAQDLKDDTAQQIAVSEAKQALIHDEQFQTNRLSSNEAKLRVAELELEQLEDDPEISQRDARAIDRLEKQIELYEREIEEASAALYAMRKKQ